LFYTLLYSYRVFFFTYPGAIVRCRRRRSFISTIRDVVHNFIDVISLEDTNIVPFVIPEGTSWKVIVEWN